MQSEKWNRVNIILTALLELDPAERERYLNNADLEDDIRNEVESLLGFEEAAGSAFNLSAVEFSKDFVDAGDAEDLLIGQQIGNYKIIRELGFGGMGAVFLAERIDGEFEQKVALKLLKREMNTAALRRRFQMERVILASLEHPNIARLLDAGTTDDKIPYIAMEYVEGLPIDDYCNGNSLGLDQRLDLFRKVCSAVDFAHRNLIVHRDLKPSNILVTKDGIPKLLDFGISKILTDEFVNENLATVTKMGVMTPGYASPEQLRGKSVTTSTDIYSLGVVLYELLSGQRPFENDENDLGKINKAVLENDPPLPSSLMDTTSDSLQGEFDSKPPNHASDVAVPGDVTNAVEDVTGRNVLVDTKPQKAKIKSQSLKGDLDNIILKALKKDPAKRYLSAEQFADDLNRHQEGKPVTARPDTFSYRAGKFVNRNKLSVLAVCLIALTLIGGIAATLWQARQTRIAAEKAKAEAAKTKKTLAFLEGILNFSSPYWTSPNPDRKKEATISEAMDLALKNVEADLKNEPEVQAEVLSVLAKSFMGKGDYITSEKLIKRSIEKFDQTYGKGNLRSLQSTGNLGDHLYLQGKLDEAEKSYLEAVNGLRPQSADDEVSKVVLAGSLTGLGNVYLAKAKFKESESLNLESLGIAKTLKGKNRLMIPVLLGNLGVAKQATGDYKGAKEYNLQAMEELRSNGNEETLEAANIHLSLGEIFRHFKDYVKAEDHLRKSYQIFAKSVGAKNLYIFRTNYRLAQFYYELQKYDKGEAAVKETINASREVYPNGDIIVAISQNMLGKIYTKQGKLREGESEIRKSLDYLSRTLKEPNPYISLAKGTLGENLAQQKRFDQARTFLKSALEGFIKTRGETHPDTIEVREQLAKIPNT